MLPIKYAELHRQRYIVVGVDMQGCTIERPINRMTDAELRKAVWARFRGIWRRHFRQRHHMPMDTIISWRHARQETRSYANLLEARAERGSLVDIRA